jgi:hypothetical protein
MGKMGRVPAQPGRLCQWPMYGVRGAGQRLVCARSLAISVAGWLLTGSVETPVG